MAKEEQCKLCKGYSPASDLCTIKWQQPEYDGADCEQFRDQQSKVPANGSSKEKSDEEAQQSDNPVRIVRRGASHASGGIYVQGKVSEKKASSTEKDVEVSERVIEIPRWLPGVLGVCLFFLLIGGVGYGIYYYLEDSKRQEREDLVWKARIELETIRDDKTYEYLQLSQMEYEDDALRLIYLSKPPLGNNDREVTDSVMLNEFVSTVAIHPNRWQTVCDCLKEAKVNLVLVYSNVLERPSVTITYNRLAKIISDEEALQEGLELFTVLKGLEVMNYARQHFSNDRYISADRVSMDDKYFKLSLSYDDSNARLGEVFLDTTQVPSHFTDPVGDMGSILDGMLSVCTRINRGVAFVYTGRRSHKVDRWQWSADKVREAAKHYNRNLLIQGRKTNQVHTVITKDKKK